MTVDLREVDALRRSAPSILWKYCGPQGLPLLETLLLKVTRPNEFNDPFELAPGVVGQVTVADLEKLYADPAWVRHWAPPELPDRDAEERRRFLEEGARALTEAGRESVAEELDRISAGHAVLCVSAEPSSVLMWSHYASNHAGFLVGIAHRRLGRLPFFPVTYAARRVLFDARTFLKVRPDVRTFEVFRRKSLEWAYEHEYRSIWPLSELIPGQINETVAYFIPLVPEAIAEIRLGCRATPDLQASILDILKRQGCRARVRRARMHPRQYRLVFEAVVA